MYISRAIPKPKSAAKSQAEPKNPRHTSTSKEFEK